MLKETCPVPWRNPNSRRKAVLIPTRDFSSTNAQQHQQDLAELAELILWSWGSEQPHKAGHAFLLAKWNLPALCCWVGAGSQAWFVTPLFCWPECDAQKSLFMQAGQKS